MSQSDAAARWDQFEECVEWCIAAQEPVSLPLVLEALEDLYPEFERYAFDIIHLYQPWLIKRMEQTGWPHTIENQSTQWVGLDQHTQWKPAEKSDESRS